MLETKARRGERRWFVLERPRRDTNGGSETEVTVTSKLQANAERNEEIEKRQKREEKAASFGGAVKDSVDDDATRGISRHFADLTVDEGHQGKQPLLGNMTFCRRRPGVLTSGLSA